MRLKHGKKWWKACQEMYFMLWNASSKIDELSSLCLPPINLGVRKLGVWSNTLLPHVYWRTYCLVAENWETVIFIWNFSKSFGQKESRQYNSQIPTSFTLENGWEAWGDTDIQECIIRHPVDCITSKARKPRKGGSNISQSFFIAIFIRTAVNEWLKCFEPKTSVTIF